MLIEGRVRGHRVPDKPPRYVPDSDRGQNLAGIFRGMIQTVTKKSAPSSSSRHRMIDESQLR